MNKCIRKLNSKKIKVEENGRKAVFINDLQQNYEVGTIDGCLIKDGIRADYFVSSPDKTILVELKGTNIKHAFEQLFASAEHRSVKANLRQSIGFLIICSSFPRTRTTTQRFQQLAKRKYGANVKVLCNQREVKAQDF